ncbi:hypothetical protein V6N11_073989 [Hibiscus sabdariffa]|uniref:Uncharacterized protein n=1 Tax=Hibiscus sabdariffa TaxID=183260 RepID=A0ABR2P563_9ROSI
MAEKDKLDGEDDENNKKSGTAFGFKNGHIKLCSRGHWRPAEDAKLMELVTYYGPQNWKLIAQHVQGRSGKSCRLRWFDQLDPRIKKRDFTEEEEERLLSAHRLYGNKWAMIARLFTGRTDNAVKNHWHVIMARKYREKSSISKRKTASSFASQALPRGSDSNGLNSACGAADRSTISSNLDESAKSSSVVHQMDPSARSNHHLLFNSTVLIMQVVFIEIADNLWIKCCEILCCVAGSLSDYVVTRETWNVVYEQGPMGVDRSANSTYSNSEVSAAESVGTNWSNHSISGERCGKINKMAFIDFLGVGNAS